MTSTTRAIGPRALLRVAIGVLAVTPALLLVSCGSGGTSSTGAAAAAAASSAASDPALFPGKKATGTPVKIGFIVPEGGPAVSQPEDRLAAQAAANYANDNLGGLAGHPIQMDVCKNLEDAASATSCANQMVQDQVAAVVVATTGLGDSMTPIITKAGIPYVSVSGSAISELTSANSFMWTGGFPGTLASMAKYTGGKGYKAVTAYVVNVAAAIGGVQQLGVPIFKAAGVTLKVVPISSGDATSAVSSGLGGDTQGVIVVGDATVCTSVLTALNTLSTTAEKMIIQPCLDPSTVKAVGPSMNGAKIFTVADTVSTDPETVLFKAVMAKYAQGTSTDGYAVVGYQGMLGLVRATASATAPTAAALLAAIRSAKDVPLPAGHGIKFTCDGKAFPGLTSVCSSAEIAETVQDGRGTGAALVG